MAKENERSTSSFQTDLFLEEYPAPEGFPSDEELFSCPPSLKGFFWPADSWAWGFADMFPPEYVPQDRAWEDLIAKESLCVKGTIKKPPSSPPPLQDDYQPGFWTVCNRGQAEVSTMVVQPCPAQAAGYRRFVQVGCCDLLCHLALRRRHPIRRSGETHIDKVIRVSQLRA